VDQSQRGLTAAAHHRHHAIALTEAERPWSESGNLPGELEARDVLRRSRWRRVATPELEHVGAVDAGRANPYEELVLTGLWIGPLLDDEAPALDRHGAHGRELYANEPVRPRR